MYVELVLIEARLLNHSEDSSGPGPPSNRLAPDGNDLTATNQHEDISRLTVSGFTVATEWGQMGWKGKEGPGAVG